MKIKRKRQNPVGLESPYHQGKREARERFIEVMAIELEYFKAQVDQQTGILKQAAIGGVAALANVAEAVKSDSSAEQWRRRILARGRERPSVSKERVILERVFDELGKP